MIYLLIACGVLIGGVFATSAASKLRNRAAFEEFVASIPQFQIPRRHARPVGVLVAAAETSIVLALVVSPMVGAWLAVAALAAAIGLLLVFVGGIVVARRRGTTAPCRCFGPSRTPLGVEHIVRNLLLAAAAGVGLGAAGAGAGPVHPGGVAVAAAAGAVLTLLTITADEVVGLLRPVGPRR